MTDYFHQYLITQYIDMYGEMGQKSNTMIFSDKPADINALFAQASTVFTASQVAKKET